jgi:hypothetical protein
MICSIRNISARSNFEIVNVTVGVRKTDIEHSGKIAQTFVVRKYADASMPISTANIGILPFVYQMNSFARSLLSYPSRTCTTRIFFMVTGDSCPIGM